MPQAPVTELIFLKQDEVFERPANLNMPTLQTLVPPDFLPKAPNPMPEIEYSLAPNDGTLALEGVTLFPEIEPNSILLPFNTVP